MYVCGKKLDILWANAANEKVILHVFSSNVCLRKWTALEYIYSTDTEQCLGEAFPTMAVGTVYK